MGKISFLTKNFGNYDPASIGSYMNIGGFEALKKAVAMDGEDIASLLASVKIKGRGGAGYDMGRKWSQARAVQGSGKIVICNADEGESCTFKDRALLENDPFNLIEAMIIAGWAIGASEGFIYMREEYSHLRENLLTAIRQAKNYGFLGENILGKKGFYFDIKLYSGAGAYVCGEGTALIRSIEGKAGRPRMKPPFIKQSGAFARPTCLCNVESLSIVPHLLLDEEGLYASCGYGESIGTKLISVGGNVNSPGVFEIPFGTPVREIIYDMAGGIQGGRDIRLIQFGGASGKVAGPEVLDVPYTYEELQAAGVGVGSGGMLIVDERTSVIDFLRMNQEFFSEESCGQCTPCREGNLHIKLILDKIADHTATRRDIRIMEKAAKVMSMSSLCGLGETAQNTLLSAMKVFPHVFEVGGAEA